MLTQFSDRVIGVLNGHKNSFACIGSCSARIGNGRNLSETSRDAPVSTIQIITPSMCRAVYVENYKLFTNLLHIIQTDSALSILFRPFWLRFSGNPMHRHNVQTGGSPREMAPKVHFQPVTLPLPLYELHFLDALLRSCLHICG